MIKIMMDQSPAKLEELSIKYDYEFWQLRTPLTAYSLSGRPYGLDNGCFSNFEEKTWLRLLAEARETPPVFACLPDVVGDARRTREMFDWFCEDVRGIPKALVLQDGIENVDIPWERIAAVFVGGSDRFKLDYHAFAACRMAKMIGKWVHVGRVNTLNRIEAWFDIADSIDGTGLIKDESKLREIVSAIKGEHPQLRIAV